MIYSLVEREKEKEKEGEKNTMMSTVDTCIFLHKLNQDYAYTAIDSNYTGLDFSPHSGFMRVHDVAPLII